MSYVVNIKNDEKFDVYIGRPSKFSNPFHIGVDGSRREVITRYENYLYTRPELIQSIRKELQGKILGCYCNPLACHGDVLVRIANGYQLPPLGEL